MNSRRFIWAAVVAVLVVALAVVVLLLGRDGDTAAPPEPATTTTTTVETTTTLATTTTRTPDTTTTTTTAMPTTAPPPTSAPPTTPSTAPAPGPVTVLAAGPGGGSGEISLDWSPVSGATGYRVERTTAPDAPFEIAADVNVTAGVATTAPDVVNLWTDKRSYKPLFGTVSEEPPTAFHYVEVISGGVSRRYFRVVAYSDAGDAPASALVCGAPPGYPPCP